ncbi:MAG: hypothetical protein ABJA62_01485 [Luteimonas sp.]
MIRSLPPDPQAATDATAAATHRREPTLGRLDDVVFRHRDSTATPVSPPRRWTWWWIAALSVLVALGWTLRQPIADRLWPQTRAQALRAQAASALAHRHLTADDGSGARELYEAALAIDPDRNEARAGLMRVAQAALAQARDAMAAGRFEDAHRALRLARELSIPRAPADAVEVRLRSREAAHAGIAALLQKARVARLDGRIDGDADAALPLYRRVLELEPDRTDALEGREDALGDLLQRAQQSLDQDALPTAAAAIAAARSYDAGHVDLPAAQASLARAIERVRKRADADLRAGRLETAVRGYQALTAIDLAGNQGDAGARQGIERVAAAYASRTERASRVFKFTEAQTALRQAQALAPNAVAVRDAARTLQRARHAQSAMRAPLPIADRNMRVQRLLAEAATAQARGDLLTPPGDSAYDKLRGARALAPDSASVRRASAQLLPTAKACFEQELRGNNLARADACLDARSVLGESEVASREARRRLAQRWLAVGDERLGAGEVSAAANALESARRLDRATPGLDAFAERVRAASAGHR